MYKLPRRLEMIFAARSDVSSLQFRLSVGIIAIAILGVGSLGLWLDWKVQQLAAASLSGSVGGDLERAKLLSVRQHLRTSVFLSLAATSSVAIWWCGRSLRPLKEIAARIEAEPSLKPLSAPQNLPELQPLIYRWNDLLAQFEATQDRQRQSIDDLAHELRMPLSTIYGYLKRTQQHNSHLNQAQKESLEMAVEEAERMNRLLQDWLNLVRSDPSLTLPTAEPFILNEWIQKTANVAEKFSERRIEYSMPPFPIRVTLDRQQLMQVVDRLLENAIRFSAEEEPVTVGLTKAGQWAVLEVRDRGCGIESDRQEQVFEPFYRADPSRTRATGGTGLGLSIVKSLVEKMGGEISVRSRVGEGSTFTVKFPISN